MTKSPISPVNSKALIALSQREKNFADALKLITKLYKKDKRQYTGVPYAGHPMTVVSLLLDYDVPVPALIAAVFEDALTKTSLKVATIKAQYGDEVVGMVLALTPPDGGIEAFKAQLQDAPEVVKTIKLASLLDDVCSIPAKNLTAAQPFIGDVAALLPALESGNAELFRRLQAAVRRAH